jgi:hypothetical protein
MRTLAALTLASLSAAALAAPQTPDHMMSGRVPGAPQSCIAPFQASEQHILDNGAILFRQRYGSSTWYLNTPADCPQLRHDRALVGRHSTGQLCSGDLVAITDPPTGFDFGSCALGDFVPYTRPKTK